MMVHHSDGVWVLDVAEKHVALGIAHKTDIRVFLFPLLAQGIFNQPMTCKLIDQQMLKSTLQ